MKLCDLSIAPEYIIKSQKCRLLADDNPRGRCGFIRSDVGDILNFVTDSGIIKFVLDSAEKDIVTDMLNRGFLTVGITTGMRDINDPSLFLMDIRFFCMNAEMGEMNVFLSDKVTSALVKHRMIKAEEAKSMDFCSAFADSFMFRVGDKSCFAFSDGFYRMPEGDVTKHDQDLSVKPETGADSKSEPTEKSTKDVSGANHSGIAEDDLQADAETTGTQPADENSEPESVTEKEQRTLILYGKNCSLYIRTAYSGDELHLVAENVRFGRNNLPCMKLGYGSVSFNSESKYISSTVKAMLQESPGYIHLWNQYAQMEGEFLLRQARAVGVLNYIGEPGFSDGKVTIFFDSQNGGVSQSLGMLHQDDLVNLGITPLYIEDPDMTWEEYLAASENKKNARQGKAEDKDNRRSLARILRVDSGRLTLEWNGSAVLPQNPVSLSILGNEKQIRRRSRARRRIENGVSANPQLGLLIDGISAASTGSTPGAGRIAPLSEYVSSKIFPKYPPTDNQRAAIDIALNTPDIAIIQGPPGTGKTTVIKAILERLNETSKKKDYQPGSVLVTSLQHDAVYNVSKALNINGMPTLKFGSRSKNYDTTPEQWELDAVKWCEDIARKIREKYPQLEPSMQVRELRDDLRSYLTYPSDDKAAEMLRHAMSLPVSAELYERAEELLSEFTSDTTSTMDDIIPSIRRLRVTRQGFEDDGRDTAMNLYIKLTEGGNFDVEDEENRDIIDVLKEAAMTDVWTKDLRKNLLRVRNTLLSRCLPPPHYCEPEIRDDIVEFTGEVIDSFNDSTGKLDDTLRELVGELEQNPEYARIAVQSYSYVFAATAQQSMSRDVLSAKHASEKEPPQYDTVIVDEAARVTPADLMIPLSQAKRRIILVGDHRQLPHIYDEDIFEELQNNGEIENHNDIKVSMFQHLFSSAMKLEKADGVRRTITLNNQYRTHPLLGQFVSDNFYPPEESFNSPLAAELFAQPISPRPLIWLDVPISRGIEKKRNTSRCREAEADIISGKLREYLGRDDCRGLTFGVITFYSVQVQLLKEKLGALADDPRVTIGSVDAFQGLEFDVVFLSVVRTASRTVQTDDLDTLKNLPDNCDTEDADDIREKIGMKYYGFLVMKNRLCVALSRQKKLLVVVGDKDVFTGNGYSALADNCVPAMKKLYQLAQKEGEVINV